MVGRSEDGKFQKGVSGNPKGRPRKDREERFYEITASTVTFQDWKEIVEKAVTLAKRGDTAARKWLSDYLMGVPVQKTELTGAEGGGLKVIVEYANREANTTGISQEPAGDS